MTVITCNKTESYDEFFVVRMANGFAAVVDEGAVFDACPDPTRAARFQSVEEAEQFLEKCHVEDGASPEIQKVNVRVTLREVLNRGRRT